MTQNTVNIEDRRALKNRDKEMIPLVLVRAMFGLALASLILVSLAVYTDRPHEAVPEIGEVARESALILAADTTGNAFIRSSDGTLLATLAPNEGGFIAGVVRGVERKRVVARAQQGQPIRLVQFTDGRLMLFDAASDYTLDLNAFGDKHRAAFAMLLDY